VEDSNPRRLGRISHTSNQQKVTFRAPPPPKDVKNEGRSGNVYENKGPDDKLPDEVSGFCAQLRPILQKTTDFKRHFALKLPFTLHYS
jgi:hypothetical protein